MNVVYNMLINENEVPMAEYTGFVCPWCGQPFTETDDIAVCPDCGTPHHRSCYLEHGACFSASLHASGYEWNAPAPEPRQETPAAAPEEPKAVSCPFCGELNDPGAVECSACGQRLAPRRPSFPGVSGGVRKAISVEDRIDGVPVKDYLIYLGRSAVRHIVAFIRQEDTGSKLGFCAPAFLSPVLFFTYYRMWGYAGASVLVTMLLNVPSLVVSYFGGTATELFGISMETWNTAGNVCMVIFALLQVLCALFGSHLLKVESTKAIKKIRRSCSNEEDYARTLASRACPSGVFYGLLLVMIFSLLVLLFG